MLTRNMYSHIRALCFYFIIIIFVVSSSDILLHIYPYYQDCKIGIGQLYDFPGSMK